MTQSIRLEKSAHALNDAVAADNRRLFGKIAVVNMISSPGSGKTSLLESLASRMGRSLFVITGDIQTQIDKERLENAGARAVQIETRGSCHLTARMIHDAAERESFSGVRLLVIENIGNLVCPSSYDLGEDEKLAVLSVAEGDEKPIKYPSLFVRAAAVVINKIDLLPYVTFDVDRAAADIRKLKSDAEILRVSCTTGEGMDGLAAYLDRLIAAKRK
jgi:hydrogenase nickel incorporation protein HypB